MRLERLSKAHRSLSGMQAGEEVRGLSGVAKGAGDFPTADRESLAGEGEGVRRENRTCSG